MYADMTNAVTEMPEHNRLLIHNLRQYAENNNHFPHPTLAETEEGALNQLNLDLNPNTDTL